MNSLYRGLMPMANTTDHMGVTIRSNTLHSSPFKSVAEAQKSDDVGRTYMNSFLHRYRR